MLAAALTWPVPVTLAVPLMFEEAGRKDGRSERDYPKKSGSRARVPRCSCSKGTRLGLGIQCRGPRSVKVPSLREPSI